MRFSHRLGLTTGFISMLMILFLTACNSGGDIRSSSGAASSSSGGSSASNAPADMSSMAGTSGVNTSGNASAGSTASSGTATDTGSIQRMVIKTANIGLTVKDLTKGMDSVQQIADRFGGYVQSSDIIHGDQYASARITIVVPSANFGKALPEIRALGKVTSDQTSGQDVTSEFVDLQARERNLESSRQSLRNLMAKARTVSDVLKVRAELDSIQGQLEQVQGRIKYLRTRSATSTITVDLQPLITPPTTKQTPIWQPLQVAQKAWAASLHFLEGIATAVISVLVFCWWMIPVAIAALVLLRRRAPFRRPSS